MKFLGLYHDLMPSEHLSVQRCLIPDNVKWKSRSSVADTAVDYSNKTFARDSQPQRQWLPWPNTSEPGLGRGRGNRGNQQFLCCSDSGAIPHLGSQISNPQPCFLTQNKVLFLNHNLLAAFSESSGHHFWELKSLGSPGWRRRGAGHLYHSGTLKHQDS